MPQRSGDKHKPNRGRLQQRQSGRMLFVSVMPRHQSRAWQLSAAIQNPLLLLRLHQYNDSLAQERVGGSLR
jgi:hypothetical protein